MLNKFIGHFNLEAESTRTLPRWILFLIGTASLIISIYQFGNSNVKYAILSLCFSFLFIVGEVHNRTLIKIKEEYNSNSNFKIVYTSLILGLALGITITYLILKIFI